MQMCQLLVFDNVIRNDESGKILKEAVLDNLTILSQHSSKAGVLNPRPADMFRAAHEQNIL
jgi:hypothetical protein